MHGSLPRLDARVSQASSSPTPITFAATTFKQRDQWSRKVARDRRMKPSHRLVLEALALCARLDDKAEIMIDPTYTELVTAAGCCKRSAIYAVAVAEKIGVVREPRHSDGRVSNAFELMLPNTNGAKALEKNQGDSTSNGARFCR
jgi:hypothetical protein